MLTPPTPAGWLKPKPKIIVLVPLSPSNALTSFTANNGVLAPQTATGDAVLRGLAVAMAKSVLLLPLSVQPLPARIAAPVTVVDAVGAVSEQLVPVP